MAPRLALPVLLVLLASAPAAGAQSPQAAPVGPGQNEPPQSFEPAQPDPRSDQAPPRVVVGIGENTGAMFDDPLFLQTRIRHVRLIVPYDVVRTGGAVLAHTDAWLSSARRRELEPLVSFEYSVRKRRRWHMPSAREYGRRVAEFRARYPWVHEYATWNEANHKRKQPTGPRPVRTAALYRELRRQCELDGCHVLAADVLLTGARRTWRWIRKFRRRAGRGPHVWGLHNYPDVNRYSRRQTRRFLRTIPRDEVWFTETGGIVKFGRSWRRNETRAAKALRFMFRLATVSPRVTRVYVYNWRAVEKSKRWDSGLISHDGRIRKAYWSLRLALDNDRFSPFDPLDQKDPVPPLGGELPRVP